eukprot:UN04867
MSYYVWSDNIDCSIPGYTVIDSPEECEVANSFLQTYDDILVTVQMLNKPQSCLVYLQNSVMFNYQRGNPSNIDVSDFQALCKIDCPSGYYGGVDPNSTDCAECPENTYSTDGGTGLESCQDR